MVPSGVPDLKLQDAGFMFNVEKAVWYHQGTEFGRRKADTEERSVERLVSYLEVRPDWPQSPGCRLKLIISRSCEAEVAVPG